MLHVIDFANMSMKAFISYSHEDDAFRKEFEKHLSGLKAKGVISTWTDRCIKPGHDWEKEIDKNLASSGLVLLLISADFLSSGYCTGVEMQQALEMEKNNKTIVVPIILRPCDWEDCPIGRLKALPEFADPISTSKNKDQAWLNVVNELKTIIPSNHHKSSVIDIVCTDSAPQLSKQWQKWLHDTEIGLVHREVDQVLLSDVFVPPDLKKLDDDINKMSQTVNSLHATILSQDCVIFGDEQSGKTTLSKQFFYKSIQAGKYPIYLSGAEINTSSVKKLIRKAIKKQYKDLDTDSYLAQNSQILIIDDFRKARLNNKHLNQFITNARNLFDVVLLLADQSFAYVARDFASLDGFTYFEILPFGNVKRSELIKRWVEIGVVESINDDELYRRVDTLKTHIDSFVHRNIVPAKPIYLLIILQTFESYTPLGVELTSYGHCYQHLIYRAFEKAKIKQSEFDAYINFLAEFAGELFRNSSDPLTDEELNDFFQNYHKSYIGVVPQEVCKKLIDHSILQQYHGQTSFKYRYIYYFYVAKYLADRLSKNPESKQQIRELVNQIHKEESANIIIFITHHTKDPWILDEIQECMMELFKEFDEAKLDVDDLAFMQDFLDELPKLILEQREIQSEREAHDLRKDQAEEEEEEIFSEEVENLDPATLLAKINKALRGIEIIGQIIRNRHGSLERETLLSLLTQAYSVGLRFLQFFLDLSDSAKDEIIKSIRFMLEEHPNINDEQLKMKSRRLYLWITYGTIYGILRKIAFSVGAKETEAIHDELQKRNSTPAVKLINKSVELQFLKKIDTKSLERLNGDLKDNGICKRLLSEIVIQHIYMHQISYDEKQKISEILEVPIERQLLIESRKSRKI